MKRSSSRTVRKAPAGTRTSQTSSSRSAVPRWLPAVAVLAAIAAVYANSLHNPFVFDDQLAIEENTSIRQLTALGQVLGPPPGDSPMTGRPLTNLSFAINVAIGGFDSFGFHVVNVAIHALAALALFGVLRRTFFRRGAIPFGGAQAHPVATGDTAEDGRAPDLLALVCTLVWALHPLVSEVMNYITQRTESLMGLGYLLAMYSAIRAESDRSRVWEIAAAIATVCAVASKEMALTIPAAVMLWDRVFAYATFQAAWHARRRLYALLAVSWLLFAVVGRSADSGMGGLSTSVWTYLLNQAPMILQYLKLSLWPVGLIFDYGVAQPFTIGDVWPALLAVAVLLAATGVALRYAPSTGYWGAWFFITLAPTTSIVPIPIEVGAERRMYLPLIAVVVLAVAGVRALLVRRLSSPVARRRSGWALAAILLTLLSIATVKRNAEYRTGLSIWQTVVDRRPHWRAHEHLSIYLRDAGRMDDSIAHLRLAAAGSPQSRHALAAALLERGDVAEAATRLREFVRERPDDPDVALARRELASALMKAGDTQGAIAELRAAAAAHPADLRTRMALGDALETTGDLVAAAEASEAALKIHPDDPVALSHLGVLLAQTGRPEAALPVLQRALALDSRMVGVRMGLTQILLALGRPDEAEQHARTLVSMAPNDADAHNLLGVALASRDRLSEAKEQFGEALRLHPGHAQARANWERLGGKGKEPGAP